MVEAAHGNMVCAHGYAHSIFQHGMRIASFRRLPFCCLAHPDTTPTIKIQPSFVCTQQDIFHEMQSEEFVANGGVCVYLFFLWPFPRASRKRD